MADTFKEMNEKLKKFIKVSLGGLIAYLILIYYLNWNDVDKEWKFYKIKPKWNDYDEIYVPPVSAEILDIHRRLNLTNPGYLGKPVILPADLPEDIRVEIDASNEEFKFNEFLSRIIPLDRELPDFRHEICKAANYSTNLPKVSVILAFYNEPFTMLMRTIYSVLKRSPPELIEEIILVDDCSDKSL